MRNLQKQIDKIHRKAAFKIVHGDAPRVHVTDKNIESLLGKPTYNTDRYYDQPPPGAKKEKESKRERKKRRGRKEEMNQAKEVVSKRV